MYKKQLFVLTRDIPNPKPDRRTTRDWRGAETWKQGTMFVIETRTNDENTYTWRALYQYGGYSSQSFHDHHDNVKFGAIFSFLEEQKDDLNSILVSLDMEDHKKSLLHKLFETGVINKNQIEYATQALQKDWETED